MNHPALLLIDIQKGFDDIDYWGGHRNNPYAETKAGELLAFWRKKEWLVFHVKHNSTNPQSRLAKGKPGNEIQDVVKPIAGEVVVEKSVNSAFIGTDLQSMLEERGIRSLVIAGLTTDHCVSTTTRMAGNLGFETFLVADACATFDKVGVNGDRYNAELIHEISLASLHDEFAKVVTLESLFQYLENPV